MGNRVGTAIRTIVSLGIFLLFFGMKIDAAAAPKTMPDGGMFDAEYYAQTNPDVVAVLGTDENVLYQHYLTSGRLEGRQPYASGATTAQTPGAFVTLPDGTLFDAAYYAAAYPDVASVIGTDTAILAQHYMDSGKLEGRKPNATAINQSTTTVNQSPATSPSSQRINSSVTNPSSYVPAQQSNVSKPTVSTPNSQATSSGSRTVYLSATGECFHSISNCGRMNPNRATRTTEREAIQQGYRRCSKCF